MKYPRLLRPAGCLILVAAAALAGCHKKPVVAVAPINLDLLVIPPATPADAVIPPTNLPVAAIPPIAPPAEPATTILAAANLAYSAGDYVQAAKNFEEYLRLAPTGDRREEALFQLGLISALTRTPKSDWQRVAAYWKQLVSEFPQSIWKPAAELILTLHGEVTQLTTDGEKRDQRVRQLTTELDRLKQIDAARRKRP